MEIVFRRAEPASRAAGLLAVGVPEGSLPRAGFASALDSATGGAVRTLLASGDFAGRTGETALLYPHGVKAKRVLVLGLGPAAQIGARGVLLAAATAARRARELGAGSLALALSDAIETDVVLARAAGEGLTLGHHRHTAYLSSGGKSPLTSIELLTLAAPSAAAKAALASGVARGEAVGLARDLASTPGQDLPPAALAERAREVARAGRRQGDHSRAGGDGAARHGLRAGRGPRQPAPAALRRTGEGAERRQARRQAAHGGADRQGRHVRHRRRVAETP